jgi:hypothetical protein
MAARRRAIVGVALGAALAGCGGGDPGGGGDDPGDDPGPRWEALIRSEHFSRLVIEVDAVAGRTPRPGVADDLIAGLRGIVDKPGGVEVVVDGALEPGGDEHGWTIAELDALSDRAFDHPVDDQTIKLHVLLVDGHHADDGAGGVILGVAWRHRNIVLFMDTIEASCGALLPPLLRDRGCAAAQLAIWTHEVGHVIGLVDNGLPMVAPHRDAEHGAHDESDGCVMYWAYEGQALIDTVAADVLAGGDGELGFDAACLADVAAVRDR